MSATGPCRDMHLLVQAELDGELDAAGAAALATHAETCPDCAALQAELATQSGRLRTGLTRYTAPPDLRAKILSHVPASKPARRFRPGWGHGASFGAGLAVAASIAVLLVLPGHDDAVPDIVAAHIRALQPGHLVDVGSSDQHTVKPWFDGRLDYAPPVRDFAAQGFPLIGARLDYLAGRPVAVLVYGRDKHLIDVFVWPGDHAASAAASQGYNVDSWTQGGMNFRAVSDLNPTELAELSQLIRSPEK
jgi:anti-sigma factor RsiW